MTTTTTLYSDTATDIEFHRIDYVKRSKVSVRTKDGSPLMTYRFNNIPQFYHPYLSWTNLDCCNGWSYDNEYLLRAVQDGKKLVAEEELAFTSVESMSEDKIARTLKLESPSVKFRIKSLPQLLENPYCPDSRILEIARRGTLADFFDLDEIISAYGRHGVTFCDREIALITEMSHTELFDLFFGKSANWDLFPAPVLGMGLGYPIESTASILTM